MTEPAQKLVLYNSARKLQYQSLVHWHHTTHRSSTAATHKMDFTKHVGTGTCPYSETCFSRDLQMAYSATQGWKPRWTGLPEAAALCSELLRCGYQKGCRGLCKCVKGLLRNAHHSAISVVTVTTMTPTCIVSMWHYRTVCFVWKKYKDTSNMDLFQLVGKIWHLVDIHFRRQPSWTINLCPILIKINAFFN